MFVAGSNLRVGHDKTFKAPNCEFVQKLQARRGEEYVVSDRTHTIEEDLVISSMLY